MAIEWFLARRECAEKWCATFWDPCSANLVSQKILIFRHSWKVTSSPNGPWTSKWVLGFSAKARGSRSGGLRRQSFLKMAPQQLSFGETEKPSFFVKIDTCLMPFQLEKLANQAIRIEFPNFTNAIRPADRLGSLHFQNS